MNRQGWSNTIGWQIFVQTMKNYGIGKWSDFYNVYEQEALIKHSKRI